MNLPEAFQRYIDENRLVSHDDRYRLTRGTENVLRITNEML